LEGEDRERFETDRQLEKWLRAWARRRAVLRRWLSPTSRLFVGIAVLGAFSLALQQFDLPTSGFWESKGGQAVLGLVGIIGLLAAAITTEAYRDLTVRRRGDARLQDMCRSIARVVQAESKIDLEDISVHVWAARLPKRWTIGPRIPHLDRRAAHIPERREHEAFAFIRGRGVVGRCWLRRREVVIDLEELQRKAPDAGTFYGALGYEERLRMSFAQLWNTRQFTAIWAYPLFAGPAGAPEFAGCVSVDLHCPGSAAELRALADNRTLELSSLLADCAGVLREEL
jgi:hypothetical protein